MFMNGFDWYSDIDWCGSCCHLILLLRFVGYVVIWFGISKTFFCVCLWVKGNYCIDQTFCRFYTCSFLYLSFLNLLFLVSALLQLYFFISIFSVPLISCGYSVCSYIFLYLSFLRLYSFLDLSFLHL